MFNCSNLNHSTGYNILGYHLSSFRLNHLEDTRNRWRHWSIVSLLADDRLEVVAADVVEPDAVVVEVVEDGQTKLVALTIVRLRKAVSEANKLSCFIRNNFFGSFVSSLWHNIFVIKSKWLSLPFLCDLI